MKRDAFIKQTLLAGAGLALWTKAGAAQPLQQENPLGINGNKKVRLRLGICADLHHDLIADGAQRLQAFINEMNRLKPDFILQMGDFCVPKEKNQPLMDIWHQFKGEKHHVIGNHDRDGGYTFDQVLAFWGAPAPYYSFDLKGYHFVILNGNERPENDKSKGYPRSITSRQRAWMKQDIAATKLPVLIFCHQGIDNDMDGLLEGNLMRVLFERMNKAAGFNKIRAVFSGHHHEDYHNIYNHIHYIQINSISYQFTHPASGYDFAHSKEPLWALVTIYENGLIQLKGRKSIYSNGLDHWVNDPQYDGYPTVACISDRSIAL